MARTKLKTPHLRQVYLCYLAYVATCHFLSLEEQPQVSKEASHFFLAIFTSFSCEEHLLQRLDWEHQVQSSCLTENSLQGLWQLICSCQVLVAELCGSVTTAMRP